MSYLAVFLFTVGSWRAGSGVLAIYHFAMRVLSGSKGHAVVGATAHQAGERLTDVRTGKVYDFARKEHVANPANTSFTPVVT